MAQERLHKIIASSGLMSRRAAEDAILEGRVELNGKKVTEVGTKAELERDEIKVDGKPIRKQQGALVVLLHKPRKVVTTKRDPEGRPTVMEYLPKSLLVNPVGRLDFESEGLLLLTNDGALANRLTHPRYGIKKVYLTTVNGTPTKKDIQRLLDGVDLDDGLGKFDEVTSEGVTEGQTTLLVTVSEGRNRFVRRMFDEIGFPVQRLKRTQVGPFSLGKIAPGKHTILQGDALSVLLKKI